MANNKDFMDLVQLHERKWGDTQYPDRPSLADLMAAPVVAAWGIQKRFIFTVHQDQAELNEVIHSIITGKIADGRILGRLFVGQKLVEFRAGIAVTPPKIDPVEKLQREALQGWESTTAKGKKPEPPEMPGLSAGHEVNIHFEVKKPGDSIKPGDVVYTPVEVVNPERQPIRAGNLVVPPKGSNKLKPGRHTQMEPGRNGKVIQPLKPQDRNRGK